MNVRLQTKWLWVRIPLLSLKEQCFYLNTDFNTDAQAKITKWPVINVFDFLVLCGYKMRTLARYGLIQVLESPFLWMVLKQSIIIKATKIINKRSSWLCKLLVDFISFWKTFYSKNKNKNPRKDLLGTNLKWNILVYQWHIKVKPS